MAKDLLDDDVRAAIVASGDEKLLKRYDKRLERTAVEPTPASIVDEALKAATGPKGQTRVPMSVLERMSAVDLNDLADRDLALYRRSVMSVLSGGEVAYS